MLPEQTQSVPETQDDNTTALVSDNDYVVVGVLAKVSVDVSGMYDFDVVLSDDAEIGEKLIWLANPETPSEDDEIAEFYDESGAEIERVPESRNITISVWLNKGVIYEPAIAVIKKR